MHLTDLSSPPCADPRRAETQQQTTRLKWSTTSCRHCAQWTWLAARDSGQQAQCDEMSLLMPLSLMFPPSISGALSLSLWPVAAKRLLISQSMFSRYARRIVSTLAVSNGYSERRRDATGACNCPSRCARIIASVWIMITTVRRRTFTRSGR